MLFVPTSVVSEQFSTESPPVLCCQLIMGSTLQFVRSAFCLNLSCMCSTAGTPSIPDLIDAVTNVNDWNMLGQGLNMPQAALGEIHLSYHGIPRMKTELFSRWLARESDPEASWIKVEAALRRMGHNTEADGVRERYLGGASTGGTGIHCIIHAVVVVTGYLRLP